MTQEQRNELHPIISAAAEADKLAYIEAAKNLNFVLHDGAIAGRFHGYYKGTLDATDKYLSMIEEKDKAFADMYKICCEYSEEIERLNKIIQSFTEGVNNIQ